MGGNMCAYATTETEADQIGADRKKRVKLHNWWKHYALNAWMAALYLEKPRCP
jgi:hypothetical protein